MRNTPNLSTPSKKKDPFRVTRAEVDEFLTKRGKPLNNKKIRRKARARLRKRKIRKSKPRGQDISFTQSDANWQYLYGKTRIAGVFTFFHTSNRKINLNIVAALCAHEIESVETLYLNNLPVTFTSTPGWANGDWIKDGDPKVYLDASKTGSDSQTVLTDLNTLFPVLWPADHKLSGHAYAYLILKYHRDLFSEGMPDISFLVKGKKCFDPRSATTVWTDNPALIINDFLTDTRRGLGVPYSDIDEDVLIDSANECDETVALVGGGTEKRYTLNSVFSSEQSADEILNEMLSSCAGSIVFSGGKYKILAGKYRTPTVSLTDDDLLSIVEISNLHDIDDSFNKIKGTFTDSENDYAETDFEAYEDAGQAEDDGETIFEDIALPCTVTNAMAQRLAKIELRKIMQKTILRARWSLKAFELDVGDVVTLTLSRYGYTGAAFEVTDYVFNFEPSGLSVELELRSTDANVYAWDTEEKPGPNPATLGLPDATVSEPITGLVAASGTDHLYVRGDGTVQTRVYLTWTQPDDGFVIEDGQIQIQFKKSTDTDWITLAMLDGESTRFYILDVKDGVNYNFRVRTINGLGATSAWLQTNHLVIGKTQPPGNVSGAAVQLLSDGIRLLWGANTDLDLSHYLIKKGTDWATAEFVESTTDTIIKVQPTGSGTITYLIKAVDTSGNESVTATPIAFDLTLPGVVKNLRANIIDSNVLLRWEAPTIGSFNVKEYRIYKGDIFGTAELLGAKLGTFTSILETVGGSYKYWVVPVDALGNLGAELSIDASLFNPPDYILYDNFQIMPADADTFTNAMIDETDPGAFIAPIYASETWDDHFTNNSFASPQDQITAGYPIYIQPSNTSPAVFEEKIDYGTVIPSSLIKLNYVLEELAGSITVNPTISYSTDDISYTPTAADSVLGINFRYVKYKLEVSGATQTALARISDIFARLDVKFATDAGNGTSSATLPVTVNFNTPFIDVDSIVVTPEGTTTAFTVVVDFNDIPNPTSFDVYIYDINGNQVATAFRWIARGKIAPPV